MRSVVDRNVVTRRILIYVTRVSLAVKTRVHSSWKCNGITKTRQFLLVCFITGLIFIVVR